MNLPTLIGTIIVAVVFIALVVSEIRKKKSGKGSCSCGGSCGGCGFSGQCHPDEKDK